MNITHVEQPAPTARTRFLSADSAPAAPLIVLLAVVFLAFHLPYLPQSLEDLDSINFALGIQDFDVAQHQPHPPGYPLFILAARAANLLFSSEATALAIVSIVAGTLGVLAIAALCQRLEREEVYPWIVAATGLAVASPLYWFTTARPLSDVAGLAAAVAAQALILGAGTEREVIAASFCAALAAGIRSQVVWLTVPLLIVRVLFRSAGRQTLHHGGRGEHGGKDGSGKNVASVSSVSSVVESLKAAGAYAGGILIWFAPLVALTGGPVGYWRALFNQGAEDLTNIQMLWTRPNVRTLVDALYYALVAPWAVWWLAAIVIALATIGIVALRRRNPAALGGLAAAFGPYFVFDVVFQETFTSRYALPLVVPAAFLAVAGARWLPRRFGLVVIALTAVLCAHIGGTSVAAFASQKAPAFRLLDDMRSSAASTSPAPVLAMDRREELDLRRPIKWVGDAMPPIAKRLPSPPQHEWLEVVKYWNSGGRAPVWFVADPLRADIDLISHSAANEYKWPVPYPVLLGGVRPNEMRWFRMLRPEWYAGEGWSLTPESAGVAEIERRGLAAGPIDAWISRPTFGGTMLVGGRNFETTPRSIAIALDEAPLDQWTVAPGFFLRLIKLPAGGASDTVKVTVRAIPPSRVAIEQFDASKSRPLVGYGGGWHEQEYNPQTGLRWRWLSEQGELVVRSPTPSVHLHLDGESPRKYFGRGSRLVVRAGQQVAFDRTLWSDFAIDVEIPNVAGTITLETDQVFAPADRSRPWRKSRDLRHLGLRIFKCEIRVAGRPGPES